MKRLVEVSVATSRIKHFSDAMPLYYSIKADAVYTTPGNGRLLVTHLIRPNKPEEIERAVMRWLSM